MDDPTISTTAMVTSQPLLRLPLSCTPRGISEDYGRTNCLGMCIRQLEDITSLFY